MASRRRRSGTIKRAQCDRSFGFIKAEDGQEYFFQRNGLEVAVVIVALLALVMVVLAVGARPP